MTPNITFTMTDRVIRRHKSDGSFWKKGHVMYEVRQFSVRSAGRIRGFTVLCYPPTPECKFTHYSYAGNLVLFHGIFGYGVGWDKALLLVKERMIAYMVTEILLGAQ